MNIVSNRKYNEMYGEYYTEPELTYKQTRDYFHGRCPYTDKPCEDWNCNKCKVEQEEREYLEEGYYDRT